MSKYKMVAEGTMFRIVALIDISSIGVRKGEFGGLIGAENNLSQEGDAWVSGSAQVFGNAQISDNAQVSGSARVSDSARVFGNARVSDSARVFSNARVFGNARVSGNAQIFGSAQIFGNTRVSGSAQIFGNARVFGSAQILGNAQVFNAAHSTPVISLTLSRHTITVDGEYLNIGCQSHPLCVWLKEYKKIGKAALYTKEQIKEYGAALRFIKHTYFKGATE